MTNRAPLKQRIHAGEILIGVNVPIIHPKPFRDHSRQR